MYRQMFEASSGDRYFEVEANHDVVPTDVAGQKPLLKAACDIRVKAVAIIPDLIEALLD
jgi:hypothetical protein